MLQTQFSKEGMRYYMVVPVEGEWEMSYADGLFQAEKIPYFLQYERRELNGGLFLYYRLCYRTLLCSVIGHLPLTMARVRNMVADIAGALKTAEDYLLEPEGIIWKSDRIFVEPDTGRLVLCYCPVESVEKGSVRELLTELVQAVDKKEDAALYMLRFYDCVTEPGCTLEDILAFSADGKEISENLAGGYGGDVLRQLPDGEERAAAEASGLEAYGQRNGGIGERTVEILLVAAGILNVALVALLAAGRLPGHRISFLFLGVGTLIVLSIFYMQMEREDSPDAIMQEYFDARQIEISVEEKERAAKEQGDMKTGGTWGETCILAGGQREELEEVIVEREERLYLAPMERGRYPSIHLRGGSLVLGSLPEGCGYLLQERGISRLHAKLMEKGDGFYLLDLNSTNGTYINGEAIESGRDYKLEEGDMVAFAKSRFYVAVEKE